PDARRGARVLRRLRRDRPVREGRRRQRVRHMTATAAPIPDLGELADVSASLEAAPASAAIEWAWDRYGGELVLAPSCQDCALIDLAVEAAPEIEVVFLDTQYHFAETLWYVDETRRRYDLNLRVMQPEVAPDNLWQRDPDGCCALRKVEPLARALDGKAAWMTGLRRGETPARGDAPVVSDDGGRGLGKGDPPPRRGDPPAQGYMPAPRLPLPPP